MRSLGLIGGTGLDHWGPAGHTHDMDTAFGPPSAPLTEFHVADMKVFFLSRHGERHQYPPHAVNYRANIDVFRQLEVDGVIAVNAVGGINETYFPGCLALPDQLIDYTWGRAHSFSLNEGDDLQHVEFAEPFSTRLRKGLAAAAEGIGQDVTDGGCIAVCQGPRLETAAEIARLKRDGCDMVGMTTMPEAALAREAGLDYACLCVNANWAAGIGAAPISMQEIDDTLAEAMGRVRKLLREFFEVYTDVC